jgi:hypothetical protein
MRRGIRIAASAFALAGLAAVLALTMWSDGMPSSSDAGRPRPPAAAIPLAVLGDSNSHSYQDYAWFPADSSERGGALRARTFQWTEVLARLRGRELDLGPWVTWGRPGVVARAREWLGLRGGRAPKKEDYLYNFANSGAACKNLNGGRFRQAPRLVELMNEEPRRWERGVVVIAIGLNNWGGLMDLQARDPAAPELRAVAAYCAGEIGNAIALIHASHPSTRILLAGVTNEADDPANLERWQSAPETTNIKIAVDGFNDAIRHLAAGNPRVAFFDNLAWFENLWGSRSPDGKPIYKTVAIGSTLRVTNTAGDDPHNAVLGDLHGGLAWNALWTQALVARLRDAFGLPLTPISDEELAGFVLPLVNSPRVPGS